MAYLEYAGCTMGDRCMLAGRHSWQEVVAREPMALQKLLKPAYSTRHQLHTLTSSVN